MVKTTAKKTEAKETKDTKKFKVNSLTVLRAKQLKSSGKVSQTIAFDMEVNGIKIYGCYYLAGEKKGKEWSMIKLPEHKGSDDNYYSIVWFPISNDFVELVEEQLNELV